MWESIKKLFIQSLDIFKGIGTFSPAIIVSLPIPSNLNGQELYPHHKDCIICWKFLTWSRSEQSSIAEILQFVEFLNKHPPFGLFGCTLELILIHSWHIKVRKLLAERSVNNIIVWCEIQETRINTAQHLQEKLKEISRVFRIILQRLTLK